ncbi:MAG: NAD(+) synthase [Flavobacteriales bacterium]|nr:NAD(+) synthase [Flavobacteriales bacterium]
MNAEAVVSHIVAWLDSYAEKSRVNGFVIGISGGIDSAITSLLCAKTGRKTLLLEMPIYQASSQVSRAREHIQRLRSEFPLVESREVELTNTFDTFVKAVASANPDLSPELALANTRARLRMTTLYYFAGLEGLLVAGTGNKVEDFGIGFFTKYGDGGVDLSPIADLTKSEVYQLAAHLGVVDSIQRAAPTDGLWGDNRTDEDQIGASYPELEWAMDFASHHITSDKQQATDFSELAPRQQEVLGIFLQRYRANRHKMIPIPVCEIPDSVRSLRAGQ